MNLTEFNKELQEQDLRLKAVGVGGVSEDICIDGHAIHIKLGRDAGIRFDYTNADLADGVRRFAGTKFAEVFRRNQEDFKAVLDSLKDQTNKMVEASTGIYNAIIDHDIPEIMMERIAGSQMSKEPQELVKQVAEKRIAGIFSLMEEAPTLNHIIWQRDIGNQTLTIAYNSKWSIAWGNICYPKAASAEYPITESLQFLSHTDAIRNAVERFITGLTKFQEIANG
jgi:hypothetical protein